jgi:hypothetical protein
MTKKLITVALVGCMAWAASSAPAAAEPVFIDVEIAPPSIETYPRTVYEGRPVYYYEGHWYEQRGPRWVYYRDEPQPLVVYRSSPEYRRHRHHAAPPPQRRYYQAPRARDRHYDRDDRRHHDDRRPHDDRHHHDERRHHRD